MLTNELIVKHIQCAHAALDEANAKLTKQASDEAEFQKLLPEAVQALVKFQRIEQHQAEKAASVIPDRVQLLKILIKTADPENTVAPKPTGTPTKQAAVKKAGRNWHPNYGGDEAEEAWRKGNQAS